MTQEKQRSAFTGEIRAQVQSYLRGGCTYAQLRDWLSVNWWRPSLTGDREAEKLLRAVQLRLGEYAAGYWSDEALRKALEALLAARAGEPDRAP